MNTSFVTQVDLSLQNKLRQVLIDQGFELVQPPHTLFQGKKEGISCTLYTSGKLVVQGKNSPDFIQFTLEPEILGTFTYGNEKLDIDMQARIGVDEAGKGDFFGPLCIAGVFAGEKEIDELLAIGVKDSKKMGDPQIQKMAKQIAAKVPHHIIRINPEKYNTLYKQFGNLNLMLAWGHATVIEELSKRTGCKRALIDQFSHLPLVENALRKKALEIDFTKKTKGESDPVVAAASILARASFVAGIENLSKTVGIPLPKGASALVVSAGIKIVREQGRDFLHKIAKLHFKTLDEIIQKSGK